MLHLKNPVRWKVKVLFKVVSSSLNQYVTITNIFKRTLETRDTEAQPKKELQFPAQSTCRKV